MPHADRQPTNEERAATRAALAAVALAMKPHPMLYDPSSEAAVRGLDAALGRALGGWDRTVVGRWRRGERVPTEELVRRCAAVAGEDHSAIVHLRAVVKQHRAGIVGESTGE